eukprot:gene69196-94832_t
MSGVLANLGTYMLDLTPLAIGASGSIFGLTGGLAMFYYRNRYVIKDESKSGLQYIKNVILINLIHAFGSSNIDQNGHIGGFL